MNTTISKHLIQMGGNLDDFIKMRSMPGKETLDFLIKPSKENYLNAIDDRDWITVSENTTTTYETHFADTDKKILVIDFECTNGKIDWKINFQFFASIPRKAYKRCNEIWFAHGGFLKAYHNINDILIKIVEDNIDTIEHIIIRGFSQGAAYTVLCTEDMEFLKKEKGYSFSIHGIAYECPRLILFLFSWNVRKRLRNVTIIRNLGDVVTHAPFISFGFIHVCGTFIKIGKWYRELFPLHFMHYVNKVYKYLPSYESIKDK